MSIGTKIAEARKKAKLTQQKLADKLGVSFQAVSSWERDEFLPDTNNLINLAKVLNVSLSSLAENYNKPLFETSETIFDWEKMYTYVSSAASNFEFKNTLEALPFAKKVHEGHYRKGKEKVPYIYHLLNMACHCLAMDINDDQIIAACLLHDTIEDCGIKVNDLPVDNETKEIVRLLTHEKDDSRRQDIMNKYYKEISKNPKACLVKCIDRCNNISSMAYGLTRDKMTRMILETEKYVLPLLDIIEIKSEYNDAAWLLKYQICSELDMAKRLM